MKKILFPTDFSKTTQNAWNYALDLADKLFAKVVTLHSYIPKNEEYPKEARKIVKDRKGIEHKLEWLEYDKFIEKLHKAVINMEVTHLEVGHILEKGEVVESILRTAIQEKADFIVMGTEGASGLFSSLTGNTTTTIIDKSPIPVLVIPHNADYHQIYKIAIALDFEKFEEDVISKAMAYAKLFHADLHCIHANSSRNPLINEYLKKLQNHFAGKPNVYFKVLESKSNHSTEGVLDMINKYIDKEDINMLIMRTHNRTFFEKLFSISYAKEMALHTDTPLLVFK